MNVCMCLLMCVQQHVDEKVRVMEIYDSLGFVSGVLLIVSCRSEEEIHGLYHSRCFNILRHKSYIRL